MRKKQEQKAEPKPAPKPDTAPIAIVIPLAWQHGPLLAGCIEAIQAGKVRPEEIIVVVDRNHYAGPTPEIGGGVQVIERTDPPGWASGCRNTGAKAAKSPWVMFIDADDLLLPEALEAIAREFQTSDSIMFCPSRYVRDEIGDMVAYEAWDTAYDRLVAGIGYCMTPNVCINREFFLSIGGFDESLSIRDDCDLACRIAGMKAKVTQLYRPFVRVRGTQSTTAQRPDRSRIKQDVHEFIRRFQRKEYLTANGMVFGGA